MTRRDSIIAATQFLAKAEDLQRQVSEKITAVGEMEDNTDPDNFIDVFTITVAANTWVNLGMAHLKIAELEEMPKHRS